MPKANDKRRRWFSAHEEKSSCMAYLHGTVPPDEIEACAFYEYARESDILRDAATKLQKLIQDNAKSFRGLKAASKELLARRLAWQATHSVIQKHACGAWFNAAHWRAIWRCDSFPDKPWSGLKKKERARILKTIPAGEIQPPMTEAGELEAMGILAELNALAGQTEARPELHHGQRTDVLLTFDFSETKKQIMRRVEAYLDSPENKKRLAQFGNNPTGRTGAFKDRLKDLAVVRLFDELGFDAMLEFSERNRLRTPADKPEPMPFHDARQGQSGRVALNQSPICSEESFCRKATARVGKYLNEIIPTQRPALSDYVEGAAKLLPKGS